MPVTVKKNNTKKGPYTIRNYTKKETQNILGGKLGLRQILGIQTVLLVYLKNVFCAFIHSKYCIQLVTTLTQMLLVTKKIMNSKPDPVHDVIPKQPNKKRHVVNHRKCPFIFPPNHLASETTYSPATLALSILATTDGISLFNLAKPPTARLNPASTPSCLASGGRSSGTVPKDEDEARASAACSASSSREAASSRTRACSAATAAGTARFSAATSSRSFSSCATRSATRWRLAAS